MSYAFPLYLISKVYSSLIVYATSFVLQCHNLLTHGLTDICLTVLSSTKYTGLTFWFG